MRTVTRLIFKIFFLFLSFSLYSQVSIDTAYLRVITQRAGKIVSNLEITDSAKYYRVRAIIVSQYSNLRTIHDARNDVKKAAKSDTLLSKTERDSVFKIYENDADAKLKKLHGEYLDKLSKELSPEQVDKVKDGMTSGKVKFTYDGYLQMILTLTDVQKKQIWDWLIEAREIAMDAESSDKKTAIFGKYKGRIANFLSKDGYDLKKEGEEWQKRLKAQESEKK
jgi:hypothetical protein